MSKITPVVLLTVPKGKVAEVEKWVHQRHVAFIGSSHKRDGPCKLNLYTTSQAPVLSDPMNMDSKAEESGDQTIAFFETYVGMEGLLDHWKLGGESGMLPDFMKLIEDGVKGDFIQPLAVRIEDNYIPKAPVEVLSGACQVFVKFLFSKELEKEVLAMMDSHAKWIKETHLEEQKTFTGDKKLLYYMQGTCPVLSNPMDLKSDPVKEGTQCMVFTEIYASKAGLQEHWKAAPTWKDMPQLGKLQEKGMKAEFYQPLEVRGSINWF